MQTSKDKSLNYKNRIANAQYPIKLVLLDIQNSSTKEDLCNAAESKCHEFVLKYLHHAQNKSKTANKIETEQFI